MRDAALLGLLVALCTPGHGQDARIGYEAIPREGTTKWVRGVSFSPDGKWLLTGGDDDRLRVFSLAGGMAPWQLEKQYGIHCLALTPAGDDIAGCTTGDSVRLFRVDATGKPSLRTSLVGAGLSRVTAASWSQDGKFLYTVNNSGAVKRWQVTPEKEEKLKGRGGATYSDASPAPDQLAVIAAGADKTFRTVPEGTELRFDKGWDASAAAFLDGTFAQGYTVLLGHYSGGIELVKMIPRKLPDKSTITTIMSFAGEHHAEVRRLVLSSDRRLLATSDKSGKIVLWRRDGQVLGRGSHRRDVRSLAFSRDGKYLASGAEDGTVRVWEAMPFRLLATLVSFKDGASLAYTPGGRFEDFRRGLQQVASWSVDGQQMTEPDVIRVPVVIVEQPPATQSRLQNRKKTIDSSTTSGTVPSTPLNRASAPDPGSVPKTTESPGATRDRRQNTELLALRDAAQKACSTGRPVKLNVPPQLRGNESLATIGGGCSAEGVRNLRAAQAAMEDLRAQYGCVKQVPVAASESAGVQREWLTRAATQFQIARALGVTANDTLESSMQDQYELAMLDLCFAGSLQNAATTFETIQPPYQDSADRAHQAWAWLTVTRASDAVRTSASDPAKLDEADLQIKFFRQQVTAITNTAVLDALRDDQELIQTLDRQVRGQRLYLAGLNAIKEGRLRDAFSSFGEAKNLLDPGAPQVADIDRRLQEFQNTQSYPLIEAALRDATTALAKSDLARARISARKAIDMAGSNAEFSSRGLKLMSDIATEEQHASLMLNVRLASGVAGLMLLTVLAFPAYRANVYAAIGLDRHAVQVNAKILASKAADTGAILRLFKFRAMPEVSDRLSGWFGAYLAVRPDQPDVLYAAGQWALERGDQEQASGLLRSALKLGVTDPGLYRALLRLPSTSVDQSDAERLRATTEKGPLQREAALLLANHYMANQSTAPAALGLYETVLNANPEMDGFRLDAARALLGAGDGTAALRHLAILLGRGQVGRPTLDAVVQAGRAGNAAEAVALLANPAIGDFDRLNAAEALVKADIRVRPTVDALYGRTPPRDPAAGAMMRIHQLAGTGDVAAAAALAESCQWPGDESDPERLAEMGRAIRRLDGQAASCLRLALARIEMARGASALAVQVLEQWRQQSPLPPEARETLLRALDRLSLPDLATAFLEQAGWSVYGGGNIASPPVGADAEVQRRFSNARIHVTDASPQVQDVLQVRNQNPSGAVFLVVPEKPRRDVYALLYATLVDCRNLSLVPLDRAAMKEAVADRRAAEVLLQNLNLWLGRGDVFDESNPISDSAAFFGRGPLIHQLLTKILNRQNFGLYGLRKMGKTSLIFQLRESFPANMLLLYVDLQANTSGTCSEQCRRIVNELRVQMRRKAPDFAGVLRSQPPDAATPLITALADMEVDLNTALAAMGQSGHEGRILLVLDEIERMIPHHSDPGFAGFQEFFRLLRGVYQERGQVVSAVVGADPTLCRLGKWGGLDNPVFQYYDEVFLAPLDRSECDGMVRSLAAIMGAEITPEGLGCLYAETAGHPFVTRRLCSRIVRENKVRPLHVTREMVMASVVEFLEVRAEYLREVFEHYLSEEAQVLLEGIATSGASRVGRAELEQIMAGAGPEPDAGRRALQELELFHLLVRQDGGFEVPMGILMRYLRADWKRSESYRAD